jgi:4-alpha-glucanotransferase
VVTGVPPDDFSRDGQRWGHPHYCWPAHARDGFAWWRARVRAGVERFDLLRIDHFIGFVRAWEVPATCRTARRGRWRPAPGRELLRAIARDLGELPFIAEDLGALTPEVIALRDEYELPGMRILQNAFHADDAFDLPHRHPANAVVYPGTHDNDTAAGWWRTLAPAARRRFLDYAGGTPRDAVAALVRMTCTSPARLGVIPMQDLLGLGSEARMNYPGRARGQWRWRLSPRWQDDVDAARIRRVIAASGRLRGARARRS